MIVINKQNTIQRFKDACGHLQNVKRRKIAVETQYNRKVWEVYDKYGIIRIEYKGKTNKSVITVFSFIGVKEGTGPDEFEIENQEYTELKDIYFGTFKPDMDYLLKWGMDL